MSERIEQLRLEALMLMTPESVEMRVQDKCKCKCRPCVATRIHSSRIRCKIQTQKNRT
ncbi:hypothetical protein O987_06300 [Comamonas testosteroni TK102]|uniref:Uncharacterized protein n=1 Tax=Comamonas testosteroni TK102 TaxID=1392005 RepID=A0A076PIE9_COMTE|nr:hypothetical protein O987_06300 [Comamonas testosteroni TK102]